MDIFELKEMIYMRLICYRFGYANATIKNTYFRRDTRSTEQLHSSFADNGQIVTKIKSLRVSTQTSKLNVKPRTPSCETSEWLRRWKGTVFLFLTHTGSLQINNLIINL